jgi:hypothetical protein
MPLVKSLATRPGFRNLIVPLFSNETIQHRFGLGGENDQDQNGKKKNSISIRYVQVCCFRRTGQQSAK